MTIFAVVDSGPAISGTMLAFVIVAAVAIVLQMVILLAMFLAVRQAADRMVKLAERVEAQTAPVLTTSHAILDDARPKIAEITSNLAESTATIRDQVSSMAEATEEIVDRARMQAARLDDLVSNTVAKVEATTDFVQHSVITPVRRIQAIAQAVSAGLSFLRANRARRKGENGGSAADVDEEMFI